MGGMTGAEPPASAGDDSALLAVPFLAGPQHPPAMAPGSAGADDAAGATLAVAPGVDGDEAGRLPVTAGPSGAAAASAPAIAEDPAWTGPDGHRHVPEDHEPGSRQHHAGGGPHHH